LIGIGQSSARWVSLGVALPTRTDKRRSRRVLKMGKQVAGVLYGVAMAAVIVGVDLVFFRNRFWERLMVNVGIVLVFAAFYFRFLKPS
jgi:hypothetical protein